MPLEPCTECGASISTSAQKCPHCGEQWPTKSAGTAAAWGCLIFAIVMLALVLFLWPIISGFVDDLFF
jgi:hypothetical protein